MPYWFESQTLTLEVGGRPITIESGRLAKQAAGAALVTSGETVVLVTVCTADPREGIDFFPLTVDFVEKFSAAGKIPGGFFKREGRLSDREVLVSRFIDRSIRPLFADGFRDETQVMATVLSADSETPPDILAFVGASTALHLSEVPFLGPISAVRIAQVEGAWVLNPTFEQIDESRLDLVVAGNRESLVMVEGSAQEVPEAEILEALKEAHAAIVPTLDAQEELRGRVGKPKLVMPAPRDRSELESRVREKAEVRLAEAARIPTKAERYAALGEVEGEVADELIAEVRNESVTFDSLAAVEERQKALKERGKDVKGLLHDLRSAVMRKRLLDEGVRIDGRSSTEIRQIACEVRAVPRAHGAAIFTRGETQALVYTTLGSQRDEQAIDGLQARYYKNFMLHYNFPPFSVGEARFLRGPSRRDVGHGNLAERALKPVLPKHEDFPYTVRVVSEVLESNGSSSMATVCGATLALLDAGVPLKSPVAGIAMGLVEDGGRTAILSDILGDEDHLGDMDFKVAGSRDGITALQMDIKIRSVDWSVMEQALEQAREGRLWILDRMAEETQSELPDLRSREEMSPYAPRVSVLQIKPDRIRDIIGPGGRVIRAIQETTGAKIDVGDTGEVMIFAPDLAAIERAQAWVEELTQDAEIGAIYLSKVKRVVDFGAFVEIFPGTEGLIHISHLAHGRVEKVTDVLSEGDEVLAKCIDIDPSGRIRLSRKEALADAMSG